MSDEHGDTKRPMSLRDWFDRLADLPAAEQREALAKLDAERPDVAGELRQMLAVGDDDAVPSAIAALGGKMLGDRLGMGDRVGPYVVLEHLASGGFGDVYKAERRTPHRQTVALKLIKPGVDTREVIARFSSERQALARMDHPHIAKVLDAGSTDAGRPYFVMEYVRGVPITTFADDNKLTIPQRLELFAQVCDAIAHAHTKAIIHRDIKAGNVLAYTADAGPIAKVIDFGIAKALTSDRLTDLTFNTAGGMVIGTYATMSPEQAAGSPDIDTRTDVYSLGVLLYELLTGVAPFDPRELAAGADEEVRRLIREVEPSAPSTRLTGIGAEESERVAKARGLRLAELRRSLRGELEWIPLKALRKEPHRRYASAQDLKADVQRYLSGEALEAGPESRAYRLKKFARRNRGPLTAAALITLGLLVGAGGLGVGLARAQSAEERRQAATQTASTLRKFVAEDLASASDPRAAGATTVSLTDAFAAAVDRMAATDDADPDIEAELRLDFARLLTRQGNFADALDQLDRVAALQSVPQAALDVERLIVEAIELTKRDDPDPSGLVLLDRARDLAEASGDEALITQVLLERAAALKNLTRSMTDIGEAGPLLAEAAEIYDAHLAERVGPDALADADLDATFDTRFNRLQLDVMRGVVERRTAQATGAPGPAMQAAGRGSFEVALAAMDELRAAAVRAFDELDGRLLELDSERAKLLHRLGRTDEARQAYASVGPKLLARFGADSGRTVELFQSWLVLETRASGDDGLDVGERWSNVRDATSTLMGNVQAQKYVERAIERIAADHEAGGDTTRADLLRAWSRINAEIVGSPPATQ